MQRKPTIKKPFTTAIKNDNYDQQSHTIPKLHKNLEKSVTLKPMQPYVHNSDHFLYIYIIAVNFVFKKPTCNIKPYNF